MEEEMVDCQHCGYTHREGYNCKAVSNSASVTGYKAMSIERGITLLQDRAEKGE